MHVMKRLLLLLLSTVSLVLTAHAFAADATDERFAIRAFELSGNQIFSTPQLQSLLMPFIGEDKTYADIQRAQRAIENLYQTAGYGAVRAATPEQELTDGVVRIQIVEARIANVAIAGNSHFNEANIRASIPALKEGELPNLREVSENVQLANQNPAKRIEVILNTLDTKDLEARVLVTDEKPLRISASLDNTGNESTGRTRLGIALQHANLFGRDHVGTIAYTTSPEKTDKVDIFSVSYRLPLYRLGDSLDFIYGYSNVQSASSQTVAGPLNFSGSGRIYGLNYNHYFARQGEFSSRLTLGLAQREYNNRCDIGGLSCGSADADVTVRPLSVTWSGQWVGSGKARDLYAVYARNIPGGSHGDSQDFDAVRHNADASYGLLRLGGSLVQAVGNGGWQARAAVNGQYSTEPLVPGEQFGLAGVGAVRGFNERAVSTDSGWVGNLELYTPESAAGLSHNLSLRALLFVDLANGHNREMISSTQVHNATLASAGVGVRGNWNKRVSLAADVASVAHSHPTAGEASGDIRGHVSLNVLF